MSERDGWDAIVERWEQQHGRVPGGVRRRRTQAVPAGRSGMNQLFALVLSIVFLMMAGWSMVEGWSVMAAFSCVGAFLWGLVAVAGGDG